MKITTVRFIVVASLLCVRLANAEDIHVFTTIKTNSDTQSIYKTEIYTRGGMTNLIRRTSFKTNSMRFRLHRIYQSGGLLGDVEEDKVNGGFGVSTEPNSTYALEFQFASNNVLRSVAVATNGILIDAFTCTNGILFPAKGSEIKKANEIGTDVTELLDPKNVRGKSPEEFGKDIEKLIQKHKPE